MTVEDERGLAGAPRILIARASSGLHRIESKGRSYSITDTPARDSNISGSVEAGAKDSGVVVGGR